MQKAGEFIRTGFENLFFKNRPKTISLIDEQLHMDSPFFTAGYNRFFWLQQFGNDIALWINQDYPALRITFFKERTENKQIKYGISLTPTNASKNTASFAGSIERLVADLNATPGSENYMTLMTLREAAATWKSEEQLEKFLPEFKELLQEASANLRGKTK